MAVVGQAYVVVRALTDKVDADIRRGFSGATASANKSGEEMGAGLARGLNRGLGSIRINTMASQFKGILANADNLSENFSSLVKKGYFVQSAFGAIAGSIGALVGGLGALAGVAGGAAASLVAVGAAGVAAKVGLSVAGFALKGISQAVGAATKANGGYSKSLKEIAFDAEAAALSVDRAAINLENAREAVLRTQDLPSGSRVRRDAELAYKEAELAYRRAQEAKEAGEDTGGGGGGTDPFEGLTPSQKQFAKYLAGLKPKLDALRESAAKGFLPLLEEQMSRLISAGIFEILEKRFYDIGEGMGLAAKNFTDVFLAGDNLKDFDSVLRQISDILPTFGKILGNVFGSFLSILVAAEPLTKRFVDFLDKKSSSFSNFLDTKQKTGELTTFFNSSGDLAARFGDVFGNVFGALGKIISANFGPGSGGDMLLGWLQNVSDGWNNMDLEGLNIYFQGAADNFMAMGDALGGAIETIIRQGANPAVAEFWENMDRGAFAFNKLVIGAVESGPALGEFLAKMTEVIAVFSDSGQVNAFFGTINFFLGGLIQTLKSLEPLLNIVGPIFAIVAAFGLVQSAIFTTSAIMMGFALKTVGTVAAAVGITLPASLLKVIPAASASGAAMTFALGPVGVAIAAIIAGIAAVAIAFNAIQGANMEKATDGMAAAFENGTNSLDAFKVALNNVDGPFNDASAVMLKDSAAIKKSMEELAGAQGSFTKAMATGGRSTMLADTFGAVGRALANIATNNLPLAQENFKKLSKEMGLSTAEVTVALNEMDEYKDALVIQADQLGINIRTGEGEIDMLKLTQFALGEGEIARRSAATAQKVMNEAVDNAAKGFVDYQGSINQNKDDIKKWAQAQADLSEDATDSWSDYWDGQDFSMEKYLADLDTQVKAAETWRTNIGKLAGELPLEIYNQVIEMGEGGAALVAGLTDGINDKEERARFIASMSSVGFDGGVAAQKGFDRAAPKGIGLRAAVGFNIQNIKKDGGYISSYANGGMAKSFSMGGAVSGAGTARSDSIPAMLSNGEFVINSRATAENRSLLEAINSNKSVSMAPNVYLTVNPSAGMDERELAELVSRKIAFAMTKGGY